MKLPHRRQFLHLAAGAAVQPTLPRTARAQTYPTRPITMIVPFPAGGATDVVARTIAESMRISLGQAIVIENVTGASGTIGVGRTARATPDGYTIDVGQLASHVAPGAIYSLRYDAARDFEPIAPLGSIPLVLYAKKNMPGKDLPEMIAWLKANPDKASHGNVTLLTHAVAALFQKETGTRFQLVPYRGEAPAIQDLLAGHIDLVWTSPNSLPHVQSGGLKAYMVTTKERLSKAPDIPTAAELGIPALLFLPWWGLFAPRDTPKDIVARLNAAVVDALADSKVQQRLSDLGMNIYPRFQQTPEFMRTMVKADVERWYPIINAAGIKPE
jgi:tripartite-type tricarboxylate transporter receptor subunit TctC